MALHIHIQDSKGSGSRFDVLSACLRTGRMEIRITDSSHLWFSSAFLELHRADEVRTFRIGEGFARMDTSGLSIVTDHHDETTDKPASDGSSDEFASCCAVCRSPLGDLIRREVVGDQIVELCCPHCAETFRRAIRIVHNYERLPMSCDNG